MKIQITPVALPSALECDLCHHFPFYCGANHHRSGMPFLQGGYYQIKYWHGAFPALLLGGLRTEAFLSKMIALFTVTALFDASGDQSACAFCKQEIHHIGERAEYTSPAAQDKRTHGTSFIKCPPILHMATQESISSTPFVCGFFCIETGKTSIENTQNTPSAGRRGVLDLLKINGLVFPAFEHFHHKKSNHYGSSNQEDG